MSEQDFHRWLRENLPATPRLRLGLGDDAAVLDWSRSDRCVVTSDLLAEGTHFRMQDGPVRIGRKAIAVNLSDLAAMASRPVAVFVSLLLPRNSVEELAKELYAGMLSVAEEFDAVIAGGDTNSWHGDLVISVTALGDCPWGTPWTRRGGNAGDVILVTGDLGGSSLDSHLDFTPRVRESQLLAETFSIHAAIDVSDGLLLDLSRLASDCQCGAELILDQIPISAAAAELARRSADAKTSLDHAMSDGEDFELIFCASRETADEILQHQPLSIPVTEIGRLVEQPGLWGIATDGSRQELQPLGYQHRFSSDS